MANNISLAIKSQSGTVRFTLDAHQIQALERGEKLWMDGRGYLSRKGTDTQWIEVKQGIESTPELLFAEVPEAAVAADAAAVEAESFAGMAATPTAPLLTVAAASLSAFAAGGGKNALDAPAGDLNSSSVSFTAKAASAPVITSNGGGATASISYAENGTGPVTTVTATDADSPSSSIRYRITGGADSTLFNINASTGAISFRGVAPDFETPRDAGANNVYEVIVTATDGSLSDSQAISVTVTDVADVPPNRAPVITSNGGGASANISIAEGVSVSVTTVVATDADGNRLTYRLSGGDQHLFDLNPTTGVLQFRAVPDFEAARDVGGDNVYDVTVTASDGALSDSQALRITVTDQIEAPVITSNGGGTTASVSYVENGTAAVTTVTATAGGAIAYSLSGADAALFNLNASSGALTFKNSPDFETRADAGANNVYDVTLIATSAGRTDSQALSVTVINQNEAPVITSNGGGTTANVSLAENSTAAITTVRATDPDASSSVRYRITGGADQNLFTINATTGALTPRGALDFENPTDADRNNVYEVIVSATDGTLSDTQALSITVTDVADAPANRAPVITSNGGGDTAAISYTENGPAAVTTVTATDADAGNTVRYSLSGTDAGLFGINAVTGVLTFAARPNFEVPADAGADNIYNVTVTATDNGTPNRTDSQALSITVTNQNEAPAGTDKTVTIDEDSSKTFSAADFGFSDVDGNSLAAVKISTLPTAGSLKLDGVAVTVGQEVLTADIGLLTFTPAANANGTGYATFTFQVRDNGGTANGGQDTDQSANTITVDVTAVNDTPMANNDTASATEAGGISNATAGTNPSGNVLSNDTDVETLTANLTVASVRTGSSEGAGTAGTLGTALEGQYGSLTLAANGGYTYTVNNSNATVNALALNATLTDSFNYTVSDGSTGTDTAVLTVTITGANDAPVAMADVGAVNEDAMLSGSVATNDSDVDTGAMLTYRQLLAGGVEGFTSDRYAIINTGDWFDANAKAVAMGGHLVAINDAAENAFVLDFIQDTAGNDARVWLGLMKDDTGNFVWSNGDDLTYTNWAPNQPDNFGGLFGKGDENFVEYIARDGWNDIDNEDAGRPTLAVVEFDAPLIGGLTFNSDGSYTLDASNQAYQHLALGFTQDVVVNYTVTDERGATSGSTLTITVTGTDDAPVAVNDSITVNEDSGGNIISVLTNDTNIDGGPKTVASVSQGSHGTVVLGQDGSVTYTPNANYAGTDSFTYTLNGGSSATVTVNVTAVDDAPVAVNDSATVSEDSVGNIINVLTNDTDIDGRAPTLFSYSHYYAGNQIWNEAGIPPYVMADPNTDGVFSLGEAFFIDQFGSGFAPTYVGYSIDGDPVFSLTGDGDHRFLLSNVGGLQGTAATFTAEDLVFDASIGGGPKFVMSVGTASHGTAVLGMDGSVSYTPDANYAGTDSFSYTLNGGSSATVTVTVTAINDAPEITSNGGGATASINYAENGTVTVTTVTATDVENNTISYSLSGTDAALFNIGSSSGALTFKTSPNFESPSDVGGDNIYNVIVTATDNGMPNLSDTQAISITVTDVVEAVTTIDLANLGVAGNNQGLVIYGVDSGDHAAAVSNAGDVNGDGYDDLLIGAEFADGRNNANVSAGDSYVVFGGPSLPSSIDLAALGTSGNTQGLVIYGADANDRSGRVLSSAGDVNGDGFDDLLLGGFVGDGPANTRFAAGDSYVIFGGASLPTSIDLAALGTAGNTQGLVVHGADASDYSGFSVSSAGDVNGDGFDDLLLGARYADGPSNTRDRAGEAYVLFGGTSLPTTVDLTALGTSGNTQGLVLYGVDNTDRSGYSVSSAGDVNGDGFDDLLIGAPQGDGAGNAQYNAGETYVVFGGANLPTSIDLAALSNPSNTQGLVIYGVDASDGSGLNVRSAGDVNGDGFNDLFIGAIEADGPTNTRSGAGESYVVYGGPSLPTRIDLSALGTAGNTQGLVVYGGASGDASGIIGNAGDVNGDGFDDLLIGAHRVDGASGGRVDAGATYVLFGGNSLSTNIDLAALGTSGNTQGVVLYGVDGQDLSGILVSSAGDVNGDGFDDLLIGAPFGDGAGAGNIANDVGDSYVVFGGDFLAQHNAAHLGGAGNDALNGTTGSESLIGGGGNDTLNGLGGNDVLIGGAGNDTLIYDAADTLQVDGGTGRDTLSLSGSTGITLDLTALNNYAVTATAPANPYSNIEIINLAGGGNTLKLSATDLLHLVGAAGPQADRQQNLLRVDGSGSDAVDTTGIWTNLGARDGDGNTGMGYTLYSSGSAQLLVQNAVNQTGIENPVSNINLGTLNGTNGFQLSGVAGGDQSGVSVSSAGDVNGDGFDDLIVGAFRADPNGSDSGASYVVFGGSAPVAGGLLALSALNGSNGFQLSGVAVNDNSGISVSSAGDVNGDGFDDLIVGASGADPNGNYSGASYVVHGFATAGGAIDVVGTSADDPDITLAELQRGVNGGAGDDVLTGNAHANTLIGGLGNDTLNGLGGNDVLIGGAGNDTLIYDEDDSLKIDGGNGVDTLRLMAGNSLDLTAIKEGLISNIERIDAQTDTAANAITLALRDLIDITEGARTLVIDGGSNDTVTFSASSFVANGTQAVGGETYNLYTLGGTAVLIDQNITQVFGAAMG